MRGISNISTGRLTAEQGMMNVEVEIGSSLRRYAIAKTIQFLWLTLGEKAVKSVSRGSYRESDMRIRRNKWVINALF